MPVHGASTRGWGTVSGLICLPVTPHLHDVVIRKDEQVHPEHLSTWAAIATGERYVLALDLPAAAVQLPDLRTTTVVVA